MKYSTAGRKCAAVAAECSTDSTYTRVGGGGVQSIWWARKGT